MKKIGIFLMLWSLLINIIFISVFATENGTSDTQLENSQQGDLLVSDISGLDAQGAMLSTEKRINNLKAAVVYEANSGTMMYSFNADTPMYPASIVKIMTALAAIENGDLTDEVVVTDTAINAIPHDAVSMKLSAGEILTLGDLLNGLIVGSANDAAVVIAEHIGGSQDKFVELMNQYAQNIGCSGTTFTNVHGLHDENQHITARDTARILDAALKNETFYKLFATVSTEIPATNKSEARNLMTGNSLMDKTSRLYFDGRAIGGRTGVTQDGRRCLAAVSKTNGMLLISVIMGSESVYQEDGYSAISVGGYKETSDLLDLCDSKYKAAQILYPGQILRQMNVPNGNNDLTVGPKETITAILPKDATVGDLNFRYVDRIFRAPVKKGELISHLQVWSNGMCIAQADMFAMNDVAIRSIDEGADSDVSIKFDSTLWIVGILVVVVICGFIILKKPKFVQNFLRSAKKRKRKKRRKWG